MSEAAPGLTVDSVTGIDVSLPVAGPGARAYAFLVDWHIRVILALGWFVCGALFYNGRFNVTPPLISDARWFGAVVAPAAGCAAAGACAQTGVEIAPVPARTLVKVMIRNVLRVNRGSPIMVLASKNAPVRPFPSKASRQQHFVAKRHLSRRRGQITQSNPMRDNS